MNRNIKRFAEEKFDLLVVGAGINGAWIALDAVLRGLKVALIDKGDFGASTSAATGRMIHGGVRYLQHMALGRLRRSLHERMLLLRNAPHLVHPMPFLIPTTGYGMKGKAILSMAMSIYDQFANRALPGEPYATIPGHHRLSKSETLQLEPLLSPSGLTGGVCFVDCQMPYPERLTLAVVKTAEIHGALVANYVRALELITDKKNVRGCRIQDVLHEEERFIHANCVVNATGPWLGDLMRSLPSGKIHSAPQRRLSKGIHIITRPLTNGHGLALATRHKHSGSWLDRGGRHFFIVPWEGLSLVGTTNVPFHGCPDDPMVSEVDIQGLIDDVNSVYPAAGLCREDVRYDYGGLYPDDPQGGHGYQGGRRDVITDHCRSEGIEGVISVIGVKYTTGRYLAQRVVDLVASKLNRKTMPCRTETTLLHGGDSAGYETLLKREQHRLNGFIPVAEVKRLIRLYGSSIAEVLKKKEFRADQAENRKKLIHAQTDYAISEEKACRLTDVVFRRTDIGLRGKPADTELMQIAACMGEKLGWTAHQIAREVEDVTTCYHGA